MTSCAQSVSVVAAAFCCFMGQLSWAQGYPAKSVRIVVPFAAGGPADIYARYLALRLQEPLGQAFVVEDRPGAGSIIGTEIVAKSTPDGYTLLLMSNTHTVNESLVPKKPFTLMKDFTAVAPINYSDLALVVHPSMPVRSVKELIALARAKPRALNYASSGTGTPYHMAGELFKAMSAVDIVHISHKGSAEARTSVMSGQVELMLDAITTMAPLANAGKVRALGTTGRSRSTVLPAVPTIAEAGIPGYEATIWLGVMAPAGTPRPVIERLNGEIAKIVARADVRKTWNEQGAQPLTMGVGEFDKYLHDDIAKWAKVIRDAGIKAD